MGNTSKVADYAGNGAVRLVNIADARPLRTEPDGARPEMPQAETEVLQADSTIAKNFGKAVVLVNASPGETRDSEQREGRAGAELNQGSPRKMMQS